MCQREVNNDVTLYGHIYICCLCVCSLGQVGLTSLVGRARLVNLLSQQRSAECGQPKQGYSYSLLKEIKIHQK